MDQWIHDILADPVTKLPAIPVHFRHNDGVIDARVFLPHTPGFMGWSDGQKFYEGWHDKQEQRAKLVAERDGVRDVYENIKMTGRVLDVGGHLGLVREFLPLDVEFVSVDPFININSRINDSMREVYSCLSRPLNFIGACAEFLPFQAGTFDWVHMRSMLDHVQSPDLALLEARRVLKPDGKLVVGLWVHGGRDGRAHLRPRALAKETIRTALGLLGVTRYKDRHTFHPTLEGLTKLLQSAGFKIVGEYWQPQWKDQVCYLTAMPSR